MRRRAAAVLVGLLCFLTACTATVEPEVQDPVEETPAASRPVSSPSGENRPFALAWDPGDTLNPLTAKNPNHTLAALVFEGLFALDASFSPEYALCQSYIRSEDGCSWTFTLREGAAFSDGTPVTAAHVADCLNAARTSPIYQARLAAVRQVSAGEGSVTVTLSAPNGALPALLDIPVFLAGEEGGYPLGTGPYCFDSSGGELCLRASPAWRGTAPLPVETILLRQTASADERIAAFDTGLVTLVDTDYTGSTALGYSGNRESWDYPTTAMLYLGFNVKKGPCRDPAVRQAVCRGVDRTNLTASLLAGHADSSALPVSPWSTLYDETLAEEWSYSIADAERILEEGGYQTDEAGVLTLRGRPVSLTLLVNSENTVRTGLADHLASELGKLGLAVTVTKLNWDEYLAALEEGSFDLCLGQVKLTADFDLTALLEGELNYGGYWDRETSELLAVFCAAAGAERKAAASALYARLAENPPFTPLCFTRGAILTQWGEASGLTPTQSNPFYGMEHWKLPER